MKHRILTVIFMLLTTPLTGGAAEIPRPELSTLISDALAAGQKKISIPRGEYSLELRDAEPMTFENLKDVEIDGGGSHVLCRIPSQIIAVRNCENLTIRGFTFDTETLPFTQGTITAVDAPEKPMRLEIEIHGGYDAENVTADRVQIFDPETRRLKKNLWTMGGEALKRLPSGRWEMIFPHEDPNRRISPGEMIVLGVKSRGPMRTHTIITDDSSGCVFEDITLYFSNCFSYLELGCHANRYTRCRLLKNEADATKAVPRLRSGNADALHSTFATRGPRVENCEFRDHGDDCIAINGNFYLVVGREGNRVRILEPHSHKLRLEAGDPVRFTSFEGEILGDAAVTDVTLLVDFDRENVAEVLKKYILHGGTGGAPRYARVYELTLDMAVDVGPGGNVYAVNRVGNGFIARNNTLGFTRARGVLVKAADGEISGNTIIGCELGAIIVAPELYWLEAGYSRDLIIENNTIRDCFFHHDRWGDSQPGAISVVATNSQGEIMKAGTLRNITVRNNTITGCPYPAIFITSTDGGILDGNRIAPPAESQRRKHGQRYAERYGLEYSQPVWAVENENIR